MHDQLRDMAHAIVRREGKISQRSRVRGQDAAALLQKQVLMLSCASIQFILLAQRMSLIQQTSRG